MAFSLGLLAYRTVSNRLMGFAERKLQARLEAGKEDPDRVSERRGEASQPRPEGMLIWFHAASVGESLSLLLLIDQILDEFPDLNVLVTTGTRSSAELLGARLPAQIIHQFVPLDVGPYVTRFLDHWKPDVAIWTESELWPNLITQTAARGTKMMLLNARMSRVSHDRWRWLPSASKAVLRRFGSIFAQDEATAGYLRRLGARRDTLHVIGSLKESSGALPHDEAERLHFVDLLKTRPVWLAASTHPGEEEIAVEAHLAALKSAHRLLLILAPRHPERAPEITEMLRRRGLSVAIRSEGREPDPSTQVYLVDTLGEMGLWYRLAPATFLGGSLVNIGGHNPYEPAALGSAIIHGPYVTNAPDIYSRLDEAGAAIPVRNAKELGRAVIDTLEPHKAASYAHAAWEVTSSGAGATERALAEITDMLDALEVGA